MESAQVRVLRTLVVSIGIGSVAFAALGIPAIIAQFPSLDSRYSITALAVYCGIPPLMAAIAARAAPGVLRGLAGFHAVSSLVLLALWVPATTGQLPGDAYPWLVNMITAAVCMAAIVLPAIAAWIYLFVIAVGSGVVRYFAYGAGDLSLAIQDGVMTALFSGVMMSLVLLALRAGRERDWASGVAQAAAAKTAAIETLERQRTRYHAFLHDDVLATLQDAAQGAGGSGEMTRRSAARALEKMNQYRDYDPLAEPLAVTELEALMRAASRDQGIELEIAPHPSSVDGLSIPVPVADALTDATTEALRNSIRHADWGDGRAVQRNALLSVSHGGIDVVVSDDGRGFTLRLVGLDRLGVRVSILQRIRSLAGGTAVVRSSPGSGTRVTLNWKAGEAE